MIKIKKYFYSFTIVHLLLFACWFIAIELTKQRVRQEAGNKIENIQKGQTPFVWNFESFATDIVEPTQKYWQELNDNHTIKSAKGVNPHLSLKFSGEVINNFIHSQLVILSPSALSGTVKIQLKQDITDEIFYYSPLIKLHGTKQVIDFQQIWSGIHNENKKNIQAEWKKDIKFTSSLVLFFNNPDDALLIDTVYIPYDQVELKPQDYTINCKGKVLDQIKPKKNIINLFHLDETCFFSSNYLWLKHNVMQRYPESILFPSHTNSWKQHHIHKINQAYTNDNLINSGLYITIILTMITIVMLVYHYSPKTNNHKIKQRGSFKKLLLFGFKNSIKPYHLSLNYAFILIPSIIIFLALAILKVPNIVVYKSLPMYFAWALIQQFVLGYLLAEKLFYKKLRNRVLSSLFAGFIFSLLHMPSVTLMLVTFIAGSFWAYAWLVFRRLIPLALSHALLAITFYEVVSERFLFSAKVFQWFWT